MSAEIFIHETAIIDSGAEISAGTKIWHFSHVMGNCKIGEQCVIGQNVMIGDGVSIGNGCKIQNNVSIYTGVVLEDGVFCGPSCVFTNVINPRAEFEKKNQFLPTIVRHGASIGANATIVCGVEIGEYAFVGAGAVVTADVPAYAQVIGVPARFARWVSRYGEALDNELTCPKTGEVYELNEGVLRPVNPTRF